MSDVAVCQDCAFLYGAGSFVEAAFAASLHLGGLASEWEVFQEMNPLATFVNVSE
jgi:hypothetical protein